MVTGHAERLQARGNMVHGAVHVGRVLANPCGKGFDKRPGLGDRDVAENRALESRKRGAVRWGGVPVHGYFNSCLRMRADELMAVPNPIDMRSSPPACFFYRNTVL